MSNESDRSVSSLGVGDIFRAGTDSDGYTKFQEKNIVYRPSDSNNTSYYGRFLDLEGNNQDAYDAEFALILGSVIATDDSIITLVPEKLDKGMESTQAVQTFNISDLSGARVLKYRTTASGELTLVDVSSDYTAEVQGLTGYDQTDQALDPTEVLVYMYKGKVKLFCILTPQN